MIGAKRTRTLQGSLVSMSRSIKWILVVAVLVGAMFYLSSRVSEKPLTRHEKAISVDALGK